MTTTIVTTNTRRRRRSATAGHEARWGSTPGTLDHDTTVASHRHFYSPFSGSPRYSRPTFSIESGWVETVEPTCVGQGTIEEVDDDEDHDNNDELNDSNDNYHERENNTRLQSLSVNAAEVRRNTFGIPIVSEVEPLPPATSPPPCPTDQNELATQLVQSPLPIDASLHLGSPQPDLDAVTEITLLQENFNLLKTALEDLQIMCTWFFAQCPVEAFTEHVDTCGAIEDSVHAVLESLTRRRQLGEEEWNVRSPGWHQKYSKRMFSLNSSTRTLGRLLAIRPTIENRLLRPHQIAAVLTKLQEHQNKMADLAKKFQASFDRLRLRHIHFLLTKAHTDAHQRSETRRIDEASFERQWYEDKAIRADLRREFLAHRTRQHAQ